MRPKRIKIHPVGFIAIKAKDRNQKHPEIGQDVGYGKQVFFLEIADHRILAKCLSLPYTLFREDLKV